MNNEQILIKAIEQAIANGWQTPLMGSLIEWSVDGDDGAIWVNRKIGDTSMYRLFAQVVIYDHDFAKALWGDEDKEQHFGASCSVTQPAFAFHLQQMVIADDPIAYLGEHID